MRRRSESAGRIGLAVGVDELVADPGDGLQHRRGEGLVDGLAQRMNVRAQGIAVGAVVAPDGLLERLARDDARGRAQEGAQQGVAGAGERHGHAGARRFLGVGVVAQLAEAHGRVHRVGGTGAAHQGFQAHLELHQREGLDEVVVGAAVEARDLVGQAVARGQHQHRGRLAEFLAQLLAQFQAVQARQSDVEDDDVVVVLGRQRQAAVAVAGGIELVALRFQEAVEVGQDIGMVFDDEDAHESIVV